MVELVQPRRRPPRGDGRAALLLSALALVGCVGRSGPPVTRVLHHEHVAGVFVSPYSYEHYLRAELASARGDDAEAAREFATARLGAEDDAFLASREAESLEATGAHEQADATLAEAHALDPASEAAWSAEGRIDEARGDMLGAARAYGRAVEAAPRSANAALALADLWMRADDADQAREVLEAFLTRAPNDHAIRVRLRLLLMAGELDQALMLASALASEGLSRAERRALVEQALSAGRPATAARLASRLPPDQDAELTMRALLAAGRMDDARRLLRSQPPEAFGGTVPWARLVVRLEDPERAPPAMAEALAVTGADPERAFPMLDARLRRAGLAALAVELSAR